MAALNAGVLAPDFTLPAVQGGQVSLREALAKGPVVLVFFKKSCPVCQYALPLLERVFQANRAANVTVLGISQDKARDTKAFLREYGVTFPVALDDPAHYPVSNAYGLTNVPRFSISLPTATSKFPVSDGLRPTSKPSIRSWLSIATNRPPRSGARAKTSKTSAPVEVPRIDPRSRI